MINVEKVKCLHHRQLSNITQANNTHSPIETYATHFFRHLDISHASNLNYITQMTSIKTLFLFYLKWMLVKRILPESIWLTLEHFFGWILSVLMPLSTLFLLCHGGQFFRWRKPENPEYKCNSILPPPLVVDHSY